MRVFAFLLITTLSPILLVANCCPSPCCRFCWSGFYVGGTIGYDWGGVRTGERSSFSPGFVTVVAAGEVPASFRLRKTRATGAGEFGYNWEMGGYFLVGLETDFQNGAGDKKTIYLSGAGGTIIDPSTSRAKSRVDWFGTLRGRIGITFCQSLFYITGGYAYGRVHDDVSIFFTPAIAGAFSGKHEQTKNGWTVGGGGEYAFCDWWSVKLEYLYVHLGRNVVHLTSPLFPVDFINYSFCHNDNIIRAGVNLHF